MPKTRTLIVKLGTSVLTQGTKKLNRARMVEIVRQCAMATKAGHKIVIVTSGAAAAGREHLNYPELPPTIASKQLLAAVGQSQLTQIWEQLFSIYDLRVGQMLLTRADLEDRERFLNARDMLTTLLQYGIIPIINENDAVAPPVLKVGDNDNLGALVAILARADKLLLLTDQKGLFTADPRSNPKARLIEEVETIDEKIYTLAGGSVSGLGTGGMTTKIQAAEVATRAGIGVVIASGDRPENICDLLEGKSVGTYFKPSDSPLVPRKRWLIGAMPAGEIHVDAGAADALLCQGKSLLPKGITGSCGEFSRGEVVRIIGPDGKDIAHGVTRYSSEALQHIVGKNSDEIMKILGYGYGPAVVHRDDLVTSGVR